MSSVGYVVVEINQASMQPERLESDSLHWDLEDAQYAAKWCAEDAARRGRGERYFVCELTEVTS